MSGKNKETSILGPSARVTGNISGEGGLRIDGQVVGNVDVTGPLHVTEGASIAGDANASELVLEGALTGDVVSTGPIALGAGARYEGTLRGSEISIAPGARVTAQLDAAFEFDLDI